MTFSRPRGRGQRRRLQIALSAAVLGVGALATLAPAAGAVAPDSSVFINEFHYDNTGTDTGEFVEIAGPAGTDLSAYSIVLYNGSGGASYDTDTLSGTIPDQGGGFGTVVVNYPSNGIQNGSPDGIALLQGSTLIQFLSYEGSFAATNGPANGVTSTDIGVSETGTEPVGQSLQLKGSGNSYADFTWAAASDDSPGAVNAGQEFTATPPTPTITRINQIQDLSHRSPLEGQSVTVEGVITAFRDFGFFVQEEKTGDANTDDDADPNTSEGIFVFTGSGSEPDNTFNPGDVVRVPGSVSEFRPGGAAENLTETQVSTSLPNVTRPLGSLLPVDINTLETVIGSGGRVPPTEVIDNDTPDPPGDIEAAGANYDPAQDGIDFYESLEGMLTRVNNGVAVGPAGRERVGQTPFGELPVLPNDGANATGTRTNKGGITITEGPNANSTRDDDFNPERVIFDDEVLQDRPGAFEIPRTNVGQNFPLLRGVISYSFGNFKAQLIADPPGPFTPSSPEDVTRRPSNELAVAEYSLENLSPEEDETTFDGAANEIVRNLRSPDLIGLTEVQDNDGDQRSGVTDASSVTAAALIQAIRRAGGPTYGYREIEPVDDQEGGEPGGNIRVAFLIREDRGLDFVDRSGGGPTTDTNVSLGPGGPRLSASPGRILDDDGGSDPAGDAFEESRKPLVGEFAYNGQKLFVVQNHFVSKGEDTPLFGRFQPPDLLSEPQRRDQAQVVNNFVEEVLAADANARVIVMGDLNDFEFSNPLADLKENDLTNLIDGVAKREKYTFVFEGNSQVLDHMLISRGLRSANSGYPNDFDVVHTTADFADRQSDHDPMVGFFGLAPPPPPPPPNGGQPGRTIRGNGGNNVLIGTPGNDVIHCGAGHDRVDGRGGNDVIYCGSGNDIVAGGEGNDRIRGGSGNDRLDGGPGNDAVYGDSGNDRVEGGPGRDTVRGGTGRDSGSD